MKDRLDLPAARWEC